MKFGLFSVADHYPGELDRSLPDLYEQLLEQCQAADELGFDSFWLAEHHFHEYGAVPRSAIWLTAAAQRTKKIRLGTAVVVLPFEEPIRTAEDFAMADMLSGGRINLGVGSGYLAHEYAGFGIDASEKRERFDEALAILKKAWTGERFSHEGRYYQYRDVQLNVKPLQQPHPPLWIAILSNQAAGFVAAKGHNIMMIPYATTEEFAELKTTTDAFRKAWTGNGIPSIPFGLHTFCAESNEAAMQMARGPMERYVRTRLFAKQRPIDGLVKKDLVAFGNPEEIVRIARKYEAAGLTEFLAIMNFGGMEHRQVLKSMELMAQEVLPCFA